MCECVSLPANQSIMSVFFVVCVVLLARGGVAGPVIPYEYNVNVSDATFGLVIQYVGTQCASQLHGTPDFLVCMANETLVMSLPNPPWASISPPQGDGSVALQPWQQVRASASGTFVDEATVRAALFYMVTVLKNTTKCLFQGSVTAEQDLMRAIALSVSSMVREQRSFTDEDRLRLLMTCLYAGEVGRARWTAQYWRQLQLHPPVSPGKLMPCQVLIPNMELCIGPSLHVIDCRGVAPTCFPPNDEGYFLCTC